VKLGDRLLGSAGCLSYPDIRHASVTTDTVNESRVWVIALIGTVVISILIIVTVIVTTAFLRWRRRLHKKLPPPDPPKVCTLDRPTGVTSIS